MTPPIASGWSISPGGACTRWKAPLYHGAHPKPTFYSIAVRARRQAYRDWLYVEVTPQLFYPQSNGYRPVASLMLQVEVLFGDRYLRTR